MSSRRRRRRSEAREESPGLPELSGRRFDDSRDVITPRGEPSSVGSNRRLPPGVATARYLGGYGAPSPMYAQVRRQATTGVVPRVRVSTLSPPASLRPTLLDSRAFGVLRVEVPRKVAFCVRRQTRREVLFAQGTAGRGARSPGKNGKYRRTQESQYSC